MFLKKNRKNLGSLIIGFAVFGSIVAVLWLGAKEGETHADSVILKANGGTDSPMLTFPGTGVGAIPDGNSGTPPQFGAPLNINFEVSGVTLANFMRLDVTMTHTWVGDVEMTLKSPGGVVQHSIVNRIGVTTPTGTGDSSNFGGNYAFSNSGTGNIWTAATDSTCGDNGIVSPGSYRTTGAGSGTPTNFDAAFSGLSPSQINGTWSLTIRDALQTDTGSVTAASLYFLGGDPTPSPTATPPGTPTATPIPEIDLTISQSAAPEPVRIGQPLTYTIIPKISPTALGGNAVPLVRFDFPNGVPFQFNSAGGTNGFTGTPDERGVTFSGGALSTAGLMPGTATLTVVITPQAAGTLTSAGGNVTIDANNYYGESNENNNTAQTITTAVMPRAATNTLDFNGDGRADYAVFRPGNGYVYASRGDGSLLFGFPFGVAGDDVWTPGDYDGDGKTDVAVWRRSTGVFYVFRSSDNTATAFRFGVSSDEPVARDYDGDGKTDYAVVRRANGVITWYIQNSGTNSFTAVAFGASTDGIAPGDYDGDGRFDLAVYRGNGNQAATFFLQGSSSGFRAQQFGLGSDLPVPGDYDGDGKTDYAVMRNTQAFDWFILRSSTGSVQSVRFGQNPHLTVQNDYDGDGRTDIAVWNPQNGTYYVLPAGNVGTIILAFGQNGDYPLANLASRGN